MVTLLVLKGTVTSILKSLISTKSSPFYGMVLLGCSMQTVSSLFKSSVIPIFCLVNTEIKRFGWINAF